jgi:hypothetical protein
MRENRTYGLMRGLGETNRKGIRGLLYTPLPPATVDTSHLLWVAGAVLYGFRFDLHGCSSAAGARRAQERPCIRALARFESTYLRIRMLDGKS